MQKIALKYSLFPSKGQTPSASPQLMSDFPRSPAAPKPPRPNAWFAARAFSQATSADLPPRPTTRPAPLWEEPAPALPRLKKPLARPTPPRSITPAILAARPKLVAAQSGSLRRPSAYWSFSLHPRIDAAERLLLQPKFTWSVRRDARRALQLLGAERAPVPATQTLMQAAKHHDASALRAGLWRGIARMRLADRLAKDDFMQVLRDAPQSRAALVHLLPLLITAADLDSEDRARTGAEGYVNLALARYPQDPFVRLCAAILARRVGDQARCRQMLVALTQQHPDYGPGYTSLAALEAEVYAQDHNPRTRARSLTLCRQNLALNQHRDMALCIINHLLAKSGDDELGQYHLPEGTVARYGRLLVRPDDVLILPLVILDPALKRDAALA